MTRYYYHFTSYKNIDSIATEGIKPQCGDRCKSINDSGGVFVSREIYGSIKMYALMRSFYLKYKGARGTKELQNLRMEIENLKNSNEIGMANLHKQMDICDKERAIKRIEQVKSYADFSSFLGGPCCLLTIKDLNVEEVAPENCCYPFTIPPESIGITYLKDQLNESMNIFDLEPILARNMYLFNPESIGGGNVSEVKHLYEDMSCMPYIMYTPQRFEFLEMPVIEYNEQRKKALTIR